MKKKFLKNLLILTMVVCASLGPMTYAYASEENSTKDPFEKLSVSLTRLEVGRVSGVTENAEKVELSINGRSFKEGSLKEDGTFVFESEDILGGAKVVVRVKGKDGRTEKTDSKEVPKATYDIVYKITRSSNGSSVLSAVESIDLDGQRGLTDKIESKKTGSALSKEDLKINLTNGFVLAEEGKIEFVDGHLLVSAKVKEELTVKIHYANDLRGVKIDGISTKEEVMDFEVGKSYKLTSGISISDAKLIEDPINADKNPQGLSDSLVYIPKAGDADLYLAYERSVEDIISGDINGAVGSSSVSAFLGENSLKRDDTGKPSQTIKSLYARYKNKIVQQVSFDQEDISQDKLGIIAEFSLKDKIEKVGDTIYLRAVNEDGTFTQLISKKVASLNFELNPLYGGDYKISGKTEVGAIVSITRGEEIKKLTADKDGKFEFRFEKPLEAGEEVIIEAKLGENKTTGELKFKVEDAKASLIRLQGSDRYLTAIEVSKKNYQAGSGTLIIASGHNTADALAAGVLAVKEDGPILLVKGNLDAPLKTEISRLRPSKIIIVGGENSVSASIEVELATMASSLIRLSGQDRYATSIAIADYLNENFDTEKIVLAEASRSVDALAVSAYAAKNNLAIVLSPADKLPEVVTKYIDDEDISHVEIVGGPAAISDTIQRSLGDNFKLRISGDNRYLTAIEVAKKAYQNPDKAVLVNGNAGLVDALSAAPYAYKTEAPILLTGPEELNKDTEKYVDENNIFMVSIIGGQNSVSSLVELKVKDLINLEN